MERRAFTLRIRGSAFGRTLRSLRLVGARVDLPLTGFCSVAVCFFGSVVPVEVVEDMMTASAQQQRSVGIVAEARASPSFDWDVCLPTCRFRADDVGGGSGKRGRRAGLQSGERRGHQASHCIPRAWQQRALYTAAAQSSGTSAAGLCMAPMSAVLSKYRIRVSVHGLQGRLPASLALTPPDSISEG